jgi:hypothetical protein
MVRALFSVGHEARAVKATHAAADSGLSRHFEGWQLGLIAVGIALAGSILAVPRAAPPTEIPVPRIDRAEQRRQQTSDTERANSAMLVPLPFDVRAVGETLRRYGSANAAHDEVGAKLELAELRRRIVDVRALLGDEPLLALRAVQTRLFQLALSRWESGVDADPELEELGGNFLPKARESGWTRGRRLVLSDAERSLMFRVRWVELAGLREQHAFAPTLEDWRAYYRFLIEHPETGARSDPRADASARLKYVDALARLDPEYPAKLARGVLMFELGRMPEAAEAFRAHLTSREQRRYALRAQNYLSAALDAAPKLP